MEYDPENRPARAGAAVALAGAGKALCELAKDGQSASDRLSRYKKAEETFDQAIEHDPENVEARMGAGKALRKAAQLRHLPYMKADCYRRAMAHYEALSSSDNILPPGYWKGVCMLHLGQYKAKDAKDVMMKVLTHAAPKNSVDLNLCGRIRDVLGDFDGACKCYIESLKGSRRYTREFYKMIERGRVHEESPPRLRPGTAPTKLAMYILDANVVIDCLAPDRSGLPPDVISHLKKIRDAGLCRIPQTSIDEAYGVLYDKYHQDVSRLLADWKGHVSGMPEDRYAANRCIQEAREAMMTAWLYSSKKIKYSWKDKKFDSETPYCGGPPTGKDVLILATAVHLRDAGKRTTSPPHIRLVTSDSDFLHFRRYIREVASIEVVDPTEAARLIARSLLEEGK